MLFIHPMWDCETERIGKRKCTPIGFALHGIAELTGFIGLLVLAAMGLFLAYRWIAGDFDAGLFWLLLIPIGVGIVSEVMFQFSWWLAMRKNFNFDYDSGTVTWDEDGVQQSFKYDPKHPDK